MNGNPVEAERAAYLEGLRKQGICDSCEGFGDHGYCEESGARHICHACGGSGKVPSESVK